ncbi:hypothetical protein [Streptomyces sp. NPDC007991]|uniref:hypothetical protein n=1 Tax=Streptomyces sp. NPDC007991 TaxID=3364803 RepID=UPI0036ED1628
MNKLRGILAGIALATAAAAGTLAINTATGTPPDTAWGADTLQDTGWGTPPTDRTGGPSVTPYDTGWG